MKALIDPRYNNRICQVEPNENIFEVAEPLYWADCPDDITTAHEFDGVTYTLPSYEYTDVEVLKNSNLTDEQKLLLIIDERNKRLSACDWTQLPDVAAVHTIEWLGAWVVYRQALRDLPATVDVNNPAFPIPPL
jgi:hypothetical protein